MSPRILLVLIPIALPWLSYARKWIILAAVGAAFSLCAAWFVVSSGHPYREALRWALLATWLVSFSLLGSGARWLVGREWAKALVCFAGPCLFFLGVLQRQMSFPGGIAWVPSAWQLTILLVAILIGRLAFVCEWAILAAVWVAYPLAAVAAVESISGWRSENDVFGGLLWCHLASKLAACAVIGTSLCWMEEHAWVRATLGVLGSLLLFFLTTLMARAGLG